MTDMHKEIINCQKEAIVKDLEVTKILKKLMTKRIFDEKDKKAIEKKTNDRLRSSKLLDILLDKVPDRFSDFVDILCDGTQKFLAIGLLKEESKEYQKEKDALWSFLNEMAEARKEIYERKYELELELKGAHEKIDILNDDLRALTQEFEERGPPEDILNHDLGRALAQEFEERGPPEVLSLDTEFPAGESSESGEFSGIQDLASDEGTWEDDSELHASQLENEERQPPEGEEIADAPPLLLPLPIPQIPISVREEEGNDGEVDQVDEVYEGNEVEGLDEDDIFNNIEPDLNIESEFNPDSRRWMTFAKGNVLSYQFDFDQRGVFASLGRKFCHRDWMNPADCNIGIKVTWSGRGSGKPKDLLNSFKATKSKQGLSTNNRKKSWWQIDLGQCLLLPTNYTLKIGNREKGAPTSWKLKGLADGEWKTIRSHKNYHWTQDTKTWPLQGLWGPMRYFKIIQTGVNSVGTHVFYLSGFELYGVLYEIGQ
ncbi:uncharacterized protein LOC111339610 isoform X2 [Stylophora pistillata]|nr:uncharacterized protein LOC111339610 isoform X2 [Stylophora pistillata]